MQKRKPSTRKFYSKPKRKIKQKFRKIVVKQLKLPKEKTAILEKTKQLRKAKSLKASRSDPKHYVDAKELNDRIVLYYGSKTPDIIEEDLAIMISKIANKIAFAPNFINYSYREEMIGDAIVKMFNALRNHKFKINKDYNPFSYFSKITWNAFCNRIKKEKRAHAAIQAFQEEVFNNLMEQQGHSNAKQGKTTITSDEHPQQW